jgi:hypothetical protein
MKSEIIQLSLSAGDYVIGYGVGERERRREREKKEKGKKKKEKKKKIGKNKIFFDIMLENEREKVWKGKTSGRGLGPSENTEGRGFQSCIANELGKRGEIAE